MPKPVEVYVIDIFPELKICQLPSIFINRSHFIYLIKNEHINFTLENKLTKDMIENAFTNHDKLIVLKTNDEHITYCLLNMSMTELLEIANQSKKFHDMKPFW